MSVAKTLARTVSDGGVPRLPVGVESAPSGARIDKYLLLGAMLIGLFLRLPGLELGLWRDEGTTYFDALPTALDKLVSRVAHSELNPPGFFLIMHHWMQAFGSAEIVFKLPALFFGLLLIPVTYSLGLAAHSRSAALIAAAMTTAAPEAVYRSQEARPYTLTALLCCLVTLLYSRALVGRNRTPYLVAFVMGATLLLYVHYTGLLLVGSLGVVTLYLLWRGTVPLRPAPCAVAFLTIFLLFTPWLQIFLTHLHTGTPWANEVGWLMRVKMLVDNVAYTVPLPRASGAAGEVYEALRSASTFLVLLILGAGATRLFLLNALSSRTSSKTLNVSGVLAGVCFVLSAAMLASLAYGGRYMFPFAPLAWALYGCWMASLLQYLQRPWTSPWLRNGARVAFVSTVSLLVVSDSQSALSLGHVEKSGVRSLTADLDTTQQDQTIYLISPDTLASTFGYYSAHRPVPFHGFPRWEHPELFSPQGYVELWNDPTLISKVEQRLRDKTRDGYQLLALIQQSGTIRDVGQLKMGRADELFSRLKDTYPLLKTQDYPGRPESVTLYLFALTPRE